MKRVNLGPVKKVGIDFYRYEVPEGTKFLLFDPRSLTIQLEVEEPKKKAKTTKVSK